MAIINLKERVIRINNNKLTDKVVVNEDAKGGMPLIDMIQYGLNMDIRDEGINIPARVLATHRNSYNLICKYGEVRAKLKASIYHRETYVESFPTTGDFVMIQYNDCGDSLITETLPRTSYFSRQDPDPNKGEQMVATNFDYVFIVSSLNRDFNVSRIERYITLAWQSGAIPVIVLTKVDLVEDYSKELKTLSEIAFGVDIIPISSYTGKGIEEVRELMQPGKTVVLLGSSGVGKSTLVNAVAGEEVMKTSEVRESDSRGRHTTTHRQLVMLPSGAMVIDTPGMRELAMWDVEEGLVEAYEDIETLKLECKFSNCGHNSEPGCAIKAAIQDGRLSEKRWRNYNMMLRESRYSQDKKKYLQDVSKKGKETSKYIRMKKSGKHVY